MPNEKLHQNITIQELPTDTWLQLIDQCMPHLKIHKMSIHQQLDWDDQPYFELHCELSNGNMLLIDIQQDNLDEPSSDTAQWIILGIRCSED